jgi:hypothetical protein
MGTGGTEAAAFEPTRSILAKRNEAYNSSGNSRSLKGHLARDCALESDEKFHD